MSKNAVRVGDRQLEVLVPFATYTGLPLVSCLNHEKLTSSMMIKKLKNYQALVSILAHFKAIGSGPNSDIRTEKNQKITLSIYA